MAYEARDVRDMIVIVMVVSFALGLLTGAVLVRFTASDIRVVIEQPVVKP